MEKECRHDFIAILCSSLPSYTQHHMNITHFDYLNTMTILGDVDAADTPKNHVKTVVVERDQSTNT
jgi:hypothetical protein